VLGKKHSEKDLSFRQKGRWESKQQVNGKKRVHATSNGLSRRGKLEARKWGIGERGKPLEGKGGKSAPKKKIGGVRYDGTCTTGTKCRQKKGGNIFKKSTKKSQESLQK